MLLKINISRLYKVLTLIGLILLTGCSDQKEAQKSEAVQQTSLAFQTDDSLCKFSQGACAQQLNNLQIELTIFPETAPSEKPLQVNFTFSQPVENLKVRVEGRDMFMGIIPLNLTQTDKNHYQSTLIYGSCSSNYMVWRMFVSFTLDGKSQTALFDFLADNEN
ncbi:hypothetical protein LZP69_04465 [Shewanella sp. AS1]|uniref:hypothetical protein n=1 Tax=Shewanella sp. AS1 TaxID=2907626 RepID=UPI001F3DFD26|nr:hypothetical protein [Shewanella sp. AS1]MCE9678452.1 hypothetical protein [Shewanella sp. AS1]